MSSREHGLSLHCWVFFSSSYYFFSFLFFLNTSCVNVFVFFRIVLFFVIDELAMRFNV